MLIDHDDRIRLWNDAFAAMLELPSDLFCQGAGIMPMIRALADRGDYGPGDPASLAQQIAERVRARHTARGERQMVNGTIVEVAWIALADGNFLFRLRDVTVERTASRFKDELIATVSHELRTPLTAIVGALGLIKGAMGPDADARTAELIEVARKNSVRLARIVDDLLDVDRLEAGAFDFQFAQTDVCALVTAAVEQNLVYAQSMGVTIDLAVPRQPVIACLDRDRIMQVMSNLLSNAAKFSPTNSRVRVRLTSRANGLRISVIDRGCGMSPQFRRRLFSRFAQENRDAQRVQAGTGLGLSICKSIVDRHGGQIQVDTREGVGTIFHIDLPYEQPDADAVAA